MEENKVTKVVTTLTAGSAKPIMVRKADAQSLANAQSQALEEKHEEQVRMLKIKEGEVTTEQPVINQQVVAPTLQTQATLKKDQLPIETQAAVEQLYAPKDVYKLVPQKTNWKLAGLLFIALIVIAIILYVELSFLK